MQPMYDPLEYHKQEIARQLAEGHPDVQRVRKEMEAKVGQALQECRQQMQRQNRSSADKYPMPAVKVIDNPQGVQRRKKR